MCQDTTKSIQVIYRVLKEVRQENSDSALKNSCLNV